MNTENKNAYQVFSKILLENLDLNSSELNIFKPETVKNIKAYQSNYLFSHLNSLEASFPITLKALSKENFYYFGAKYIKNHPSVNSNLDMYGDSFGPFLKNQNELKNTPMISYLAQIDWFLFQADASKTLTLPKGVLKLWESILNDTQTSQIEIDESIMTEIQLKIEDGDTFLFESPE